MRGGANNYITRPISWEEVRLVAEAINDDAIIRSELDYLRDKFWPPRTGALLETNTPGMRAVYERIRSVAPTRATVLLCGEAGTGKGVMANLIHRYSNREKGRFIGVHCGSIPDTLLESELFGHAGICLAGKYP
jgi:DNA-binding NtrC family response regulator